VWTALPERRPLILRGGALCVRAYVRTCVRACVRAACGSRASGRQPRRARPRALRPAAQASAAKAAAGGGAYPADTRGVQPAAVSAVPAPGLRWVLLLSREGLETRRDRALFTRTHGG